MTSSGQPLYRSAAYVNGQLMATQVLLFAVARAMPDRAGLRHDMLRSLELLRSTALCTAMPDDYGLGIDQVETTLQQLLPAEGRPL